MQYTLSNWDKMIKKIDTIEDESIKRFIRRAITQAVVMAQREPNRLDSDFDILFFFDILYNIVIKKEIIIRELQGEDFSIGD